LSGYCYGECCKWSKEAISGLPTGISYQTRPPLATIPQTTTYAPQYIAPSQVIQAPVQTVSGEAIKGET